MFVSNDSSNRLSSYPKHLPKTAIPNFARHVQSANFCDFCCSQFAHPVPLTAGAIGRIDPPPFGMHIHSIVQVCTQEQMIRVAAEPCIALMQHAHLRRYRAVRKLPGKPCLLYTSDAADERSS